MEPEKSSFNDVRWIARIAGSLLVLFVLVSFIGNVLEPLGTGKITTQDIPLMIGFISMVMGIIVAWFREGIGGLLTVGGFVFFYAAHLIIHKNLPGGLFFVFFLIVGLLFLLCGRQSRKLNHSKP